MLLRLDRLRELREERGWSQREFSKLCGLGENMIYRYESGRADPSASHLRLIAEKLNVSGDYLLGLSNERQGQYIADGLSTEERDLIDAYRREGWPGVMRLIAEHIERKNSG